MNNVYMRDDASSPLKIYPPPPPPRERQVLPDILKMSNPLAI